jgi:DNA polymerase III delta prime subunit
MTLLGLIFEPYKGQFKEEMKTKGGEGEKDENIFDNLYETRPQMNVNKEIYQMMENDSGMKFIIKL